MDNDAVSKHATSYAQALGAINSDMTRNDHLCFCSVCLNRKFTLDNGFICSLTDKQADFENSCKEFIIDKDEKQIRLQKYKDEIDLNIKKHNTLLKKLLNGGHMLAYLTNDQKPTDSGRFTDNIGKEIVIMESSKNKGSLLAALIVFPCLMVIGTFIHGINVKDKEDLLTIGCLVIPWGLLLFLYLRNTEIFRMGELGIIVDKKEFIAWHRIEFIHLKTEISKNENSELLVLRLGYGDDKKIVITHNEYGIQQLGTLTYNYLKRFKKN